MSRLHHLKPLLRGIKKFKKPLIPPIPLKQERFYQKDLKHIVTLMRHAIDQLLIPQLPALAMDAGKFKGKPFRDDASSDTDKIFKKIKLYLDKNVNAEQLARVHASDVNKFNTIWFQKQMEHILGINVFSNDAWLQDHLNGWIAQNVALITSLQDQALQQVNYQVHQGFLQGLRPESIAKHIKERLDVADNRAELIGRDQVSKLNGQLNEQRQTDLGIISYTWRTAEDERVRDSHAELDGETFDWDDPPDEGHPGEPINCRCIALPLFTEDYLQD